MEWVTFDTEQARSLLSHELVHYVPYIAPRDYRSLLAGLPSVVRILARRRYARVVTTGAGVALPFVALANASGVPCHYVESAARGLGPSFTGRLIAGLPGVRLYTQHAMWADTRWQYRGSVFDGFAAQADDGLRRSAGRVVVTLGTMRQYGFRRAVEALVRILPEVVAADAEVLWQVGPTDVSGLPVHGHESVPLRDLHAAVQDADLVVTHAGIGSALMALESGRRPVLLPRRMRYDEHVDDHQTLIGRELSRRDLAVSCEVDDLTSNHLAAAGLRGVEPVLSPFPFQLAD